MITSDDLFTFEEIEAKINELPEDFKDFYIMYDVSKRELVSEINENCIFISSGFFINDKYTTKKDIKQSLQDYKNEFLKQKSEYWDNRSPYFSKDYSYEMNLDLFDQAIQYTEFEYDFIKFKAKYNEDFEEEILFMVNTYSFEYIDEDLLLLIVKSFATTEEELIQFSKKVKSRSKVKDIKDFFERTYLIKISDDYIYDIFEKDYILK